MTSSHSCTSSRGVAQARQQGIRVQLAPHRPFCKVCKRRQAPPRLPTASHSSLPFHPGADPTRRGCNRAIASRWRTWQILRAHFLQNHSAMYSSHTEHNSSPMVGRDAAPQPRPKSCVPQFEPNCARVDVLIVSQKQNLQWRFVPSDTRAPAGGERWGAVVVLGRGCSRDISTSLWICIRG